MKKSFRLSDAQPDARRDVDDELAFHLEMRTREFIEQGMSPDDAARAAARSFGDLQDISAGLRRERADRLSQRGRREWWQGVGMDFRYALRSLRANPAFSSAAVGTLGLGLGAALAVFTVVNGVLVRPLPYRDPASLSMVWISAPGKDGAPPASLPLTSGFFIDLRRDARTFEAIAAFRAWPYSLSSGAGDRESVSGARVSPALFDILGARPWIGQGFVAGDERTGARQVAMISYALWRQRFGGDSAIVGKLITLSDRPFTVVGVMPPGFTFPRGAELPAPFQFGLRTDVWTPLVFDSTDVRNYGTMNLSAVGRLKGDASAAAAEHEATGLMHRFLEANAPTVKLDYRMVSLAAQASGPVKKGLLILLGAVALLLLIAFANVAGLLVARAAGRQRELAVRAALGAGRGRIARQLVTENLVLGFVGSALGIGLSVWGTRVMLALVPGSMPRADDIRLDWRVLGVAAALGLLASVGFGVVTAWSVNWKSLASAVQSGARTTGGSARRVGRQLLVAGEVAMSVVLLIGAALLTRSFVELQHAKSGIDPDHVLTAGVLMPIAGQFNPARDGAVWISTFNQLTERVGRAVGVVAAGAVSSLPLSGAQEGGGLAIVGRPPEPAGQGPQAQYSVVSGDYFRAAGIRVIAGRTFDARDNGGDSVGSIVVNRAFARRWFANESDALGHGVVPTFTFARGRQHAIVGVVDDVKQRSLDDAAEPQVYVPIAQMAYPGLTLVVRTSAEPLSVLATVKRELSALNPAATVNDVLTMRDVFDHSLARQRFSMTLIAIFAASALTLAIVGLYGVIALAVGQRTREIGVRLALGARPVDVVRMVLGEGTRVAAFGVIIGVLVSVGATRVLRTFLYGVSTTDAATFSLTAIIVTIMAVVAAWLPARRASAVDPTTTLRAE